MCTTCLSTVSHVLCIGGVSTQSPLTYLPGRGWVPTRIPTDSLEGTWYQRYPTLERAWDLRYPLPWIGGCLWKDYLPSTSFAGGNKLGDFISSPTRSGCTFFQKIKRFYGIIHGRQYEDHSRIWNWFVYYKSSIHHRLTGRWLMDSRLINQDEIRVLRWRLVSTDMWRTK